MIGKRTWEYELDTSAPPESVLAVLTNFTEKRLHYWPALSAKHFHVLELGDKSALVREGTATGWAIERYDWSEPGVVRWTLQDSNLARPGTIWEMRVTPKDGGSHVDVHFERDYKGLLGLFFGTYIAANGGGKLLAKYLRKTLDILEAEQGAA